MLTFIASRVSTNIRELEGALTRVVAFSSLTGRAMSVDLAQDVLKDVFPQGEAAEVSIKRIQDLVAERFNMSLEELCGDKRSQNIVYPRQVAMYLSRELTDSSLPKIGKEFGGRDHTTVIHATSKIARLIREDIGVDLLAEGVVGTKADRDIDIVAKIASRNAAAAGKALYDHVMGSRARMHRSQAATSPAVRHIAASAPRQSR